jgi:plasmid stabilization system protein ParE
LTAPLAIKVSSRASAQIDEVAEWWADNRPSAPAAVRHDVSEILGLLIYQPGAGTPARRSRVPGVRRAILPRIRYYLYYRVSGSTLEVLAFRHMSRSRQPYGF